MAAASASPRGGEDKAGGASASARRFTAGRLLRDSAISSTGIGEYFIRFSVAHDICARVEYRGTNAQQAADEVVQGVLKPAGGEGGVVGLDRFGRVIMSFNTTGMSRGYIGETGEAVISFTMEDGAAILQK